MGKTIERARTLTAICAALAVGGTMLIAATPANAKAAEPDAVGGWSEEAGARPTGDTGSGIGLFATPKHTGKAEIKDSSGTKRAHGWTTWAGTKHYTTAQLEHYWPNSGVIATSGRKYGTGGTEAVSPWKAYNPNATSNGNGQARTYYGR